MKYNAVQEAIVHSIEGPNLVIACPGAGKTFTLLLRIRHMIEMGIPEENILMVTFTKNAANEMKERYQKQFGHDCKVSFKTIHSLCFSVLKYAGLYNASDILSEHEIREFLFKELSQGQNYIEDAYEIVKKIQNEISYIKNNYTEIENYEAESCETSIFKSVFLKYQSMLEEQHKLDYDEMMLQAEALLQNDKKLLSAYQNHFLYIQCDEYQDTNPAQKNILYLLADKHKNLCVVGDDDQSIYGFRGAEPTIMLDFQKDFPKCKVFQLGTNYRSGQKIVDVASELISKNTVRFQKEFHSQRGIDGFDGTYVYRDFNNRAEEMDFVVNRIKSLHKKGISYSDMAILVRTNTLAQVPMDSLMKYEIPFKTDEKAHSIYDKWIFKLLCSYLHLSCGKWNQQDINDILTKPNKYLRLSAFRDCPYDLNEMLSRLSYMDTNQNKKINQWQKQKAKESIQKMFEAFPPNCFHSNTSPILLIKALEKIGINVAIRERASKRHEDIEEIKAEFAQLTSDAARFYNIDDWFRHAKEDKKHIKQINDKKNQLDGVNIMTMHAAKGCEWKYVFVIDVTQNIVPHRNSLKVETLIEEERRLLYVAMTRAKDGLYVLNSGIKSIFMEEIMETKQKDKIKMTDINPPQIGDLFIHKRYGIGVFQGWERSCTMKISFAQANIKKFNFPDALEDGYLTAMD